MSKETEMLGVIDKLRKETPRSFPHSKSPAYDYIQAPWTLGTNNAAQLAQNLGELLQDAERINHRHWSYIDNLIVDYTTWHKGVGHRTPGGKILHDCIALSGKDGRELTQMLDDMEKLLLTKMHGPNPAAPVSAMPAPGSHAAAVRKPALGKYYQSALIVTQLIRACDDPKGPYMEIGFGGPDDPVCVENISTAAMRDGISVEIIKDAIRDAMSAALRAQGLKAPIDGDIEENGLVAEWKKGVGHQRQADGSDKLMVCAGSLDELRDVLKNAHGRLQDKILQTEMIV